MIRYTVITFFALAAHAQEPPPPELNPLVTAVVEAQTEQEVIQQLEQDPNLLVKPRTPKTDQKDPQEKAKALSLERSFGVQIGYDLKGVGEANEWSGGMGFGNYNYGVSFRPPLKYLGRLRFEFLKEHHPLNGNDAHYMVEKEDGRHYINPLEAKTYTIEYDVWLKTSKPGSYQDWFSDFGLSLGYYQGKSKLGERTVLESDDYQTYSESERGIQIRIRNMPWKEIMASKKSSGGIYFMSRISSHGRVSIGIGADVQFGPKVWIKQKVTK